jgi:hypothetical protein
MNRIARVTGERFDADQIQWACDECGRSEYDCECEVESNAWPKLRDFPGGVKPEVEARIARFVNPETSLVEVEEIGPGRIAA